LDLSVSGVSPGRYSLTVHDGYIGSDPRIQPDRFEENDYCLAADANFQDPARRIDLGTAFADTLTIDEPYEVDWFRFTVPPAEDEGQLLSIRTAARPFGAADSSDVGLVLFRVDSLETFLDTLTSVDAESHAAGSDEELVADVTPGDYYLIVMDEAGVPTRYSLCMAIGNTCALPASDVRRAGARHRAWRHKTERRVSPGYRHRQDRGRHLLRLAVVDPRPAILRPHDRLTAV
jgi:hypothetical protein